MYSRLRLAGKYLSYYLSAANGRGHGIHSPFVYDFVRHVVKDRMAYAAYGKIETLRRKLLRDHTLLEVEDQGAGSVGPRTVSRPVAAIAQRSAKSARLGQLLYRIAKHYRPGVVVELGTSLGLSTAYLAAGMNEGGDGKVWTIEGAAPVALRAADHMAALGLSNVEVLTGNFDDRLEPLLAKTGPVDLAFIDGNHRYDPTMRYFNQLLPHTNGQAMLVFDDIHWSAEMERAWGQIRADGRVMLTIDLFFFGIVAIRDSFKVKQDFTIRF